MAYLSGKQGSVKIGATSYNFSKWKLSMKTGLPKVTNFTSGGFQALVGGIVNGSLTVEGPYNSGAMPFTVGSTYSWILGFDNVTSITVSAVVESIDIDDDVEGNPKITITSQSTGTFSAAIV